MWKTLLVLSAVLLTAFDTPRVDTEPEITIVGNHSVAQADLVEAAVASFTGAGLSLPATSVHFHASSELCGGHLGRFVARAREPHVVRVCSDLPFVVTHELAHSWIHDNVDEATRAAYLEFRGLATWNDRREPWMERGMEDAAFMLQQILMVMPPDATSELWKSRYRAFLVLVGGRDQVA